MRRRGVGCLLIAVIVAALVLAVAVWGLLSAVFRTQTPAVVPEAERCVVTAAATSVAVDPEQAHYAALIAGVAIRRGLPPRAVTIALTTAYQESGIRNLEYGDRDSVGLFQQRPSQGWGTAKQIMDPFYSTGKFYDALIKISNWQRGDITEMAQRVQRSGFPDAYREHEGDARILASVLTGQSPAGISCLDRSGTTRDAAAVRAGVGKTLGITRPQLVAVTGTTLTYQGRTDAQSWAIAQHALANAGSYGVAAIQVGDELWTWDPEHLASWGIAPDPRPARQVVITLR